MNAVKTIEDEIINISNDQKLIIDITIESNEFEIKPKSKLATLEKLVTEAVTRRCSVKRVSGLQLY